MLSSIRNNRKALSIVLWLVIIAFVATIFVVWGVGEKTSSAIYAVKVGDHVITESEFIMQNRMAEDELRRFGGQVDNLSSYVLQSMIEKKDRRLNRQFKLLMKKDREIEQKNKQIELISEKLAKAYHYKVNKCSLKEKEQNNIDCDKYKDCTSCVKQYFKNQSKLFKYDYNKKSTLDINSNAEI